MKSTYEARALKFARILCALFADCVTLGDFVNAIEGYNYTHTRELKYAHGVSRMAIIRADYVIKFDMAPVGCFKDGRAGNIESELAVYERAVLDGYAYLLAKTTVGEYDGIRFAIMPRVDHVHDEDRWYGDYLTEDEMDWLEENVKDLHDGNLGYRRNKPVIIDYAWDAEERCDSWTESTSSTSEPSIFSGFFY